MSRTIEYWQDKCIELEDELHRLRETTVRREDVVPLGEALESCLATLRKPDANIQWDTFREVVTKAQDALDAAREKGIAP